MKLLVVSHPCSTVTNQSFFADVEEETGWSLTLVAPERWTNSYGSEDGLQRWPAFKGNLVPLPVFLPGDIPRHLYRSWFARLLEDASPDVIYVHHEPYGFATMQVYLANWLRKRRPIGFYTAQNIHKTYPFPIRKLETWVLQSSSFAFPVTHGALDVLRSKQYAGAAEVLPLPVDANIYHPAPAAALACRQQMGIAPDRFILGYAGRLVEEKGLGSVLAALAKLRDLPWEMVMVGEGPFEAELRRQAASLGIAGRVHWTGYVPHADASAWLTAFDALVLASETRPNWKEQFGRVLVEAMACGTPVIGSDSGEIPHIIAETGGGLIVPEKNVDELATAIRSLIRSADTRDRLTREGQRSVARMFDQKALARRFALLIEQAATTPKAVTYL
jgi:glycosyltransferase involved in cell wall biosynthesis